MVQEVEEDIWGQILQESTRKNIDTVETRTVIVLGDRNSGKSSLLARTHHEDITDINKGVALTYTFLDAFEDDNDDPVGRFHFWQVEGELSHSDLLLSTAFRPSSSSSSSSSTSLSASTSEFSSSSSSSSSLSNMMAVIVLDFSKPWTLAATLKKWLGVLSDQLKAASSSPSFSSSKDQLRLYAQTYHYNRKKKEGKERKRRGNEELIIKRYKEPTADATTNKKKKKKATAVPEDPSLLPPLDDTVLTNNLSIPIVVVCSKCDALTQLESDFNYNEGTFEYIQQHLRRICLSYGATLIYTSARKETNCELLVDYIEHRLFGFELRQRAQLLEKDSIFIPFGWDSLMKIKLDFDNQKLCKDPDEPYENIITKPHNLKRKENAQQVQVTAEDDQNFLAKHKATLESESDKQKEKGGEKGRGLMATIKGGASMPTLPSSSSPSSFDEDESPRPITTPRETTPVSAAALPHPSSHPSTPPTAPAAAAPDARDANKDVLRVMKGESRAKTTALRNDVKAMLSTPTKK